MYEPRGPLFRREFRTLTAGFGVQGLFQPYSLRRGGATWHFAAGKSLDATIVRGRWQSSKTARIYIEDAVAAEVAAKMPREAVAAINEANLLWSGWLQEWKSGV